MAEKDEHQHDNEDHKRTNCEDPSKPWETLFDDDRDDQGNLSRVATKKKRQGSSKLTWILAILLILVVLAPIIYVKISGDQSRNGANLSNDRVVIQSTKKSSKVSKSKKSSKASKASKTSVASSQAASTQPSQAPSVTSQQEEQTSASAQPSEQASSSTAGSSYTVQAGDNLYRIAVNHGMTLDELLQMNGMSAGSSIAPGTVLKVK